MTKNHFSSITCSKTIFTSQKYAQTIDLDERMFPSFGIFQKSQIFQEILNFSFFRFLPNSGTKSDIPLINDPNLMSGFSHFSLSHLHLKSFDKKPSDYAYLDHDKFRKSTESFWNQKVAKLWAFKNDLRQIRAQTQL